MYEEFFHLQCRPFDLTSDPKFIFMTAQHARAVANCRFALLNRDSFVIITGEIGIGKTTILNTVIEELGPEYVTAKLVHTTLSDIELLQALLSEFGMPNYTRKKVLLLDTLRGFFLENHNDAVYLSRFAWNTLFYTQNKLGYTLALGMPVARKRSRAAPRSLASQPGSSIRRRASMKGVLAVMV